MLLITKPYEVKMGVEEILIISHQINYLHAVVKVFDVDASLSFQARLIIR